MRLHHHREILVDVPVDFICFMLSMPLIMECDMPSAGLAIAEAWALARPTDAESAAVSAKRRAALQMVVGVIFTLNSLIDKWAIGPNEQSASLCR